MPQTNYKMPQVCLLLIFVSLALLNLLHPLWFYEQAIAWQIFWHLQVPQVVTALIVGSALSASAAVLQVLLRNPLADPGMIGISSGASLMAALLLLSPLAQWNYITYLLPLACFTGALASTWLMFYLARKLAFTPAAVILAGIALSTISSAVVAWLYLYASPNQLRDLTFWLMGSLQYTDLWLLGIAGCILLPCVRVLSVLIPKLNRLYLGPQQASLLGIDVRKTTQTSLFVCAVMVGLSVAIAGAIAFIGLLVPHVVRKLTGHDNRTVIPISALVGGIFLLCIVTFNTFSGSIALPVSLLTATIGGPFFIYILFHRQPHLSGVRQ
jgi:iron complex transport system permease protein